MMGARSIHQASAVAGRACVPATPRAARVAGARARLPAPHRQQLSTVRRALIDTELPVADAWDLDGRAALLGLTVDEVARLRDSVDERTWLWMGNAEPESLFALTLVRKLLQLSTADALRVVAQQPALLTVPARALEENLAGLASLLQLPQAQLLRMLQASPALLLQGRRGTEAQLQRVARGLGVPASGADGWRLLQLLAQLGGDWLLDAARPVQRIQAFAQALSLTPVEALLVLRAEQQLAGRSAEDLLNDEAVRALAAEYWLLCDEVGMEQPDLMSDLAEQMASPQARYTMRSVPQLRADLELLQAHCQLEQRQVLGLLLAAPSLVDVPAAFWRMLLQYVLFLAPQWRQQLEAMSPLEAGSLLAQLFADARGDDSVSMSATDACLATADADYTADLEVLEALVGEGLPAPVFVTPQQVQAAKIWRLLYLCNPLLTSAAAEQRAAQQLLERQQRQQQAGAQLARSPWSWVTRLQLPRPLVGQLQQRGALSCELPGPSDAAAAAAGGGGGGSGAAAARQARARSSERIESLWEVAGADSATFCARHPGFAHWLHNASYVLEWSGSKAVAASSWGP